MMKILIFTEGGGDLGFGHVTRCMSLYKEALKVTNEVQFIIDGEESDFEFLGDRSLRFISWKNESFLSTYISNDDFAIVDSYHSENSINATIASKACNVLFIDDLDRKDYPKGVILNPTADEYYVRALEAIGNVVLSGPEYLIIRPSFFREKYERNFGSLKRVLVTFGGTDIKNLGPFVLNHLIPKMNDVSFDVVIGSNDVSHLYSSYLKYNNVNLYININEYEMSNLMFNCDLAISSAGQTVFELLATSTPFIPIRVIENQDSNIRFLLRHNPYQMVLEYDDPCLVNSLLDLVNLYITSDYAKYQMHNYRGIVDALGAQRVIHKLTGD